VAIGAGCKKRENILRGVASSIPASSGDARVILNKIAFLNNLKIFLSQVVFTLARCFAKTPATAAVITSPVLATLAKATIIWNGSICVTSPNVAKASKPVVTIEDIFEKKKNFANFHDRSLFMPSFF
jgi:hypothetical protein